MKLDNADVSEVEINTNWEEESLRCVQGCIIVVDDIQHLFKNSYLRWDEREVNLIGYSYIHSNYTYGGARN